MRYKRLLLLPILGILLFYAITGPIEKSPDNKKASNYMLIIERGAFHYDAFKLTKKDIQYIADTAIVHELKKYNFPTHNDLDSLEVLSFFQEIEAKDFWNLKDSFRTDTSCTSSLKITFKTDKKSKTVHCEDYNRNCPALMKYIEGKVVELEGNDLKRIYLPG